MIKFSTRQIAVYLLCSAYGAFALGFWTASAAAMSAFYAAALAVLVLLWKDDAK